MRHEMPSARPRRATWRRRAAIVGGIAICLVITGRLGSQRRPTGADAGVSLAGEQVAAPRLQDRIRLGTFNIHGGRGTDDRLDLDRTSQALAGLELVGLNEVHGPWLWQTNDQAEILGRALGMNWVFAPAERRWWHHEYGNALLAQCQVTSWQRIPLQRRYGKSCRNVLLARVPLANRELNVLVTHIDRSDDRERREQLRTVGELFLALAEPAVLLGDLNTSADEPALARILAAPGVRDPIAEYMSDPPRRIDWILCRGLDCARAEYLLDQTSDHPCMRVELVLPRTSLDSPGRAAGRPSSRR